MPLPFITQSTPFGVSVSTPRFVSPPLAPNPGDATINDVEQLACHGKITAAVLENSVNTISQESQ